MTSFTHEMNGSDICLIIRPDLILSGRENLSRDSHLHQLVTYSQRIVIDFTDTRFMDITALRQILSLRDWAWQQALDFHVIHAKGQVSELLDSMDVQDEYWGGRFEDSQPSVITVL